MTCFNITYFRFFLDQMLLQVGFCLKKQVASLINGILYCYMLKQGQGLRTYFNTECNEMISVDQKVSKEIQKSIK